jgi:hypothetical protein
MHSETTQITRARFSTLATLLIAASITALSGCAPEQSAVRDDFGNSVRAMIAGQTYQPGTEAAGLDGGKAANTMDVYRSSVSKPKTVKDPIILQVGQ